MQISCTSKPRCGWGCDGDFSTRRIIKPGSKLPPRRWRQIHAGYFSNALAVGCHRCVIFDCHRCLTGSQSQINRDHIVKSRVRVLLKIAVIVGGKMARYVSAALHLHHFDHARLIYQGNRLRELLVFFQKLVRQHPRQPGLGNGHHRRSKSNIALAWRSSQCQRFIDG